MPIARSASAEAGRVTPEKKGTFVAQAITVTTDPPVSPITPTVTHYQQLAADFVKALDQIATIIPQLQAAEAAVAKFTRGQLGIPEKFCVTAIKAVEQVPELLASNVLDPTEAYDTLQFLEAFNGVRDKALQFAKDLKFTFDSRKAGLSSRALQVYALAKALVRDKRNPKPHIESHVENLKRDLARPLQPKAERDAKKEAKFNEEVERRLAARIKEVKAAA